MKTIEAAKLANGRSRLCAKCPFNTKPKSRCNEEIWDICSNAFINGFIRGANWNKNKYNNLKNK